MVGASTPSDVCAQRRGGPPHAPPRHSWKVNNEESDDNRRTAQEEQKDSRSNEHPGKEWLPRSALILTICVMVFGVITLWLLTYLASRRDRQWSSPQVIRA